MPPRFDARVDRRRPGGHASPSHATVSAAQDGTIATHEGEAPLGTKWRRRTAEADAEAAGHRVLQRRPARGPSFACSASAEARRPSSASVRRRRRTTLGPSAARDASSSAVTQPPLAATSRPRWRCATSTSSSGEVGPRPSDRRRFAHRGSTITPDTPASREAMRARVVDRGDSRSARDQDGALHPASGCSGKRGAQGPHHTHPNRRPGDRGREQRGPAPVHLEEDLDPGSRRSRRKLAIHRHRSREQRVAARHHCRGHRARASRTAPDREAGPVRKRPTARRRFARLPRRSMRHDTTRPARSRSRSDESAEERCHGLTHFSTSMPWALIFRERLSRARPIASAVREMFQPCSARRATRNSRSKLRRASSRARRVSSSALGPAAHGTSGRSATSMRRSGRHDHQPLHQVSQLAHVAGPGVRLHQRFMARALRLLRLHPVPVGAELAE